MSNKRTFGYIEIIFDIAYLITVFGLGAVILFQAESMPQRLYGIMAFVLVIGDSFHLIPRIISAFRKDSVQVEGLLGVGKMITSVGMTVFYIILWGIGAMLYMPQGAFLWTGAAVSLAFVRIVITLLPQNRWGKDEAKWNIYRNIPFFLLGIMTGYLYWYYRAGEYMNFRFMWLAILISFLCYIPVVLWVKKYPMVGMLMLPKSCAYVWIITMGIQLGTGAF